MTVEAPVVAVGRLDGLYRWPVKSMGGEQVDHLELDARGAFGDRCYAVFDTFKGRPRRLTAREAPRLLAWRAITSRASGSTAGVVTVRAPDGTSFDPADPALAAALSDDLGRPVSVEYEVSGQQDLPQSVLVTCEATLQAVSSELAAGGDLRRYRTNLHVTLNVDAFAEERWEGHVMLVGKVEFILLHPCKRCAIPTRHPDTQEKDAELLRWLTEERAQLFGINARVVRGGTINDREKCAVLAPQRPSHAAYS